MSKDISIQFPFHESEISDVLPSTKESTMSKWDAFKPLDDGGSADIQAGAERIRKQVKLDLTHMSTKAFAAKTENKVTMTTRQLKDVIDLAYNYGADKHVICKTDMPDVIYNLILKRLHI